MSEVEKAAMLLRRKLSELEISGGVKSNDAVRLTESLYEIERLLGNGKE
ncbi:MAG: hypothetical protein GJ680_07695 [Alteromonadaceae bacterium]|nr:hypothetical protein [Alteromonadaceae bacterium]